ncbi:MAG: bifunctional UDP-N-acetylglucosamine diphosphorylase/glucosamine-1-phosphate N-acetyltransferase GlmU, partial [Oscillospiraceae bacterium]
RLYDAGVDIPLADGVMIGPNVTVGADTRILPGCILRGKTTIGARCVLGPNTVIADCRVGDDCSIDSSRLAESRIGNGVRIGPFAQLRPNCDLADRVKIGNFVEVKNSRVGERTSLAHLTYIGDSDFGAGINVGCGVVTVNYDGRDKYRTVVEDGAFIGCNTNLLAPVRVGAGAYVAAATTVTEDVEPDALAIGRVRQVQKPGRARLYRKQ